MTLTVKIDILNWIMFHADSSLNRRAIGNKKFTRKLKDIFNRIVVRCLIVVGKWRGTVYKTVIAQSTAFLNGNKGEMT